MNFPVLPNVISSFMRYVQYKKNVVNEYGNIF